MSFDLFVNGGLGLPVVIQIMELFQGGVDIESENGQGTRVCLWLPYDHPTR
jgi:signal transduction histidine kinase